MASSPVPGRPAGRGRRAARRPGRRAGSRCGRRRGRRRRPAPAAAARTARSARRPRLVRPPAAVGAQPPRSAARVLRQSVSTSRVIGLGAFGGDQAGQLAAAGDKDQAAGLPGSSGRTCSLSPALSSTISILFARQQAAVQRSLAAVEASRDPPGWDGQGVEEDTDGLGWRASGPAGPKPRRFTYSCPSGNPPACLVRPVHRQRGLTHPRRPADHRDRRRAIAVWRFWQQRRHRGKLRCPPGEPGNLGGQHPRARGTVRETSAPGAAAFPGCCPAL